MKVCKFIKVITYDPKSPDGPPALINVDQISFVQSCDSSSRCRGTCIYLKDGSEIYTTAKFEDIQIKIKEAEECYK